jgi:regulatory protein
MVKVTTVGTQRSTPRRVRARQETGSATGLSNAAAIQADIHEGQTLSDEQIAALQRPDEFSRSLNCALRLITVRPRSRMEINLRLTRRGFEITTIEEVLAKLELQGLVDDTAFARFWLDSRERYRPLGRRLIAAELRQKGVDREIIAEVVADVDEDEGAYQAAQKKSRSLSGLDHASFRRRLVSFLRRRGYDYSVAVRMVDRVWQEHANTSSN